MGNVLLQLSSELAELSEEQLYGKFEPPEPGPMIRVDKLPLDKGVPKNVYAPVCLGQASEDITLSEGKIYLSDFGAAFRPSEEQRFKSHTPLDIRPPEARFEPTKPLTLASDIWTLACMIWAILGQRSLLGSFLMSEDDVTADQVSFLGRLPPAWWDKWEERCDHYEEYGTPKDKRVLWTFEQRFDDSIQEPRRQKGLDVTSQDEREAFLEMIRPMVAYRPADRPTVDEVLSMPWMKRWGLPEYANACAQ